ncbi:MAG: hypothetical protein AAF581_00915 [Planctomycetota bacterium]
MGIVLALATLLFHAPLWLAARRFVHGVLRPETTGTALRDTFLTFCVLWHLETLLLGALGLLNPIVAFLLHGLVYLAIRSRVAAPALDTTPPHRWDSVATGGWVAVAVGLAIYRVLALPDPYDSMTYHLMLPVHWLQTGTLALYATTFGDIAPTYTPAAVEGFFLALMLPTGSDLLARVGQLPFLLAGGHAVASLVRVVGTDRTPAWAPALAATIFLMFSEQLRQGTGSMVDVGTSTYFLTALVVLLTWRQHPDRRGLLLFGGALAGMFLASRFQSLLYVPLLLMPVLGPLLEKERRRLLLVLVPLGIGAFPFLRNLLLTGNPVYPVEVPLAFFVLPGLFTSQATHLNAYHIPVLGFYGSCKLMFMQSGLSIAAAAVIAPFVGFNRQQFWLTSLAIVMILGHIFVVPYNANLRFLFAPWGLLVAALCAGAGATLVGRFVAVGIGGWFVAQSIYVLPNAYRWNPDEGLVMFRLAFVATFVLGGAIAWSIADLKGRGRAIAGFTILGLVVASFGYLDSARRDRFEIVHARDWGRRYAKYAPEWLQLHEIDRPSRIAYAGLNLPYPLCGLDQQHTVFSVPLDGRSPQLLPHELAADFTPSDRTVEVTVGRTHGDVARWQQQLVASEVDYLAIYADTQWQPVELRWAEQNKEMFQRVSRDGARLILYEVKRP